MHWVVCNPANVKSSVRHDLVTDKSYENAWEHEVVDHWLNLYSVYAVPSE